MVNKLVKLAFVMAFIVVTLGALTRLMDAGLGCPDWPGCYGQIIPPEHGVTIGDEVVDEAKAWYEMVHRYVASALGLVIIFIAFAVQSDKTVSNSARWLSRLLVVLVIIQGLFGMWTVTMKLLPQVVTLHLLGGMTILGLLYLLNMMLKPQATLSTRKTPESLALFVLLLLAVQIGLGGWTSSNYAGLACTDFPTCEGQLLPPLQLEQAFNFTEVTDQNYEGGVLASEVRVTIQYVHRVVALTLAILLLSLFALLRRIPELKTYANALLAFTVLQISLGISAAVMMLPLAIALAHNTGAALLLLAVIAINYRLSAQETNS